MLAVFPLLVLLQLSLRGSYGPRLLMPLLDGIRLMITAASMAAIIVIAFQSLFGNPDINSPVLRLWVLSALYLSAGRILVNRIQYWTRVRGRMALPTLIVGAGVVGRQVARRLLEPPEYGLRAGRLPRRRPSGRRTPRPRVPVLGGLDELEELIDETGAGHVILAFSSCPDARCCPCSRACEELRHPRCRSCRGCSSRSTTASTLEHLGGMPLLRCGRSTRRAGSSRSSTRSTAWSPRCCCSCSRR